MIEINGKKYIPKKDKTSLINGTFNLNVGLYALLAGQLLYADEGSLRESNPLEGIDIIKEYELVQKKKSSLSARKRNMVVKAFENSFQELTIEETI
jgi:hypothetical protein